MWSKGARCLKGMNRVDDKRQMYNCKTEVYRNCKVSAASYSSHRGFLRDLIRRRNNIRAMRKETELQAEVLRSAESALSEQIEKITAENEEMEKCLNGRCT